MRVYIWCDGAAMPNGGPAGAGYVVVGGVHLLGSEALGDATNNVAEYTAVRNALRAAADAGATSAHVRMDSPVVFGHLSGASRARAEHLIQLKEEVEAQAAGKRRVLGVDAGTVALVSRWLELRGERRLPSGGPLFCTLAGRPLDQSYIRHLLPRLARKAAIERRVHAHGLRHSFAVDLVRSGAPLYVVRDALGHTSIATTQVYLSRVGAHEAVDAMRNRDWHAPRD